MEIIFFLIIMGVMVAGGFLAAFFWAVKSGQYEDSYTPAVRILFDDGTINKSRVNKTNSKTEIHNNHNNSKQESK